MKKKRFQHIDRIQHPNNAKIYIQQNSVHLDINGSPFIVDIVYDGNIYIESHLGVDFRITYSPNRIRIINLLQSELPDILFTFSGSMVITSCYVLPYKGEKFNAKRVNTILEKTINYAETKFEDDNEVLRFEDNYNVPKVRGGQVKPKLNPNASADGFFQKFDKEDRDQIKTKIQSFKDRVQKRREKIQTKKRVSTSTYKAPLKVKKVAKKIKGGY